MNMFSLIIGLLVGILLVLFGAQNAQPVSLHFFGWESSSVPLVLALGIALLLGAALALIFSVPGRVHGWRERRGLERQVEEQGRRPAPDAVASADSVAEGVDGGGPAGT